MHTDCTEKSVYLYGRSDQTLRSRAPPRTGVCHIARRVTLACKGLRQNTRACPTREQAMTDEEDTTRACRRAKGTLKQAQEFPEGEGVKPHFSYGLQLLLLHVEVEDRS